MIHNTMLVCRRNLQFNRSQLCDDEDESDREDSAASQKTKPDPNARRTVRKRFFNWMELKVMILPTVL